MEKYKLKMHTPDLAEENFKKLAALFPNAVTETITGYTTDENGKKKAIIERAIDADVLRQEIFAEVVEGRQERYQFTWPDKRKSVVLANAPIAKTLRLDREKSVGRDGTPGSIDTENIYIEGDNLDALKLLQETYLGKVKMIYIDPPYNTGSDAFVYDDDSFISKGEFAGLSGQYDEDGNMLFGMQPNNESNGRFHTDWLNMLYPRLRIAKDLLADDGVIFISIDDNEVENLEKICDEIFGTENVDVMIWRKSGVGRDGKMKNTTTFRKDHEYILIGYKREQVLNKIKEKPNFVNAYPNPDDDPRGCYKAGSISRKEEASKIDSPNYYTVISPSGKAFTRQFDIPKSEFDKLNSDYMVNKRGEKVSRIYWGKNGDSVPSIKIFVDEEREITPYSILLEKGTTTEGTKELSAILGIDMMAMRPKPSRLIQALVQIATGESSIILDFFSGSATAAHAVMQLNAEDGGNRKFIMVQLPEVTADKSEARKAGYRTICDIGEERIRRAGKKIKEETGADIDYGFRVFCVDSSNMEEVYYKPGDLKQEQLSLLSDNIKPDRTPEDLLFQVMLDLGIQLSSTIEETAIAGKRVFSVAGGYLLACFDKDVTEETVTEIAKRQPFYAVFRDSSLASDSVAVNFDQIFETYSPKTVRKVL